MKIQTNLIDQIETKRITDKAKRLCKLYKCELIDLIVMSIDEHANNNNNNIKQEN
jgi:hypothetical protein